MIEQSLQGEIVLEALSYGAQLHVNGRELDLQLCDLLKLSKGERVVTRGTILVSFDDTMKTRVCRQCQKDFELHSGKFVTTSVPKYDDTELVESEDWVCFGCFDVFLEKKLRERIQWELGHLDADVPIPEEG